jgi:hypothetical protein
LQFSAPTRKAHAILDWASANSFWDLLTEVVKAAIELDVSGYVRKPFTQVSLLKTVDRSLTRLISPKAPGEYDQVLLPRPGN